MILDELRIAKIVSNRTHQYEHILNEAKLIKCLKHSGIPVIYDILSVEDSICVIEEYICGKSLAQYQKLHKNMSIRQICDIGIQLCNILEYMHEYGDHGILYLDLKPEHVMIDENQRVYIIDFDNSRDSTESIDRCYGSIGFAAPEQYHRLSLGHAADIYSLGMLFLFMSGDRQQSKVENLRHKELYPIIKKCLKHSPILRYRSVTNVKTDLQKISKQNLINITEKSHNIYVYGTRRGVGTTHLALCITSYLARNGKKTVCIEHADKQDLRCEAIRGELDQLGFYHLGMAYLLPNYEEFIVADVSSFDFRIYDCGVMNSEELHSNVEKDGLILLVGNIGYRKEQEDAILLKCSSQVRIFLNHISTNRFYDYLKQAPLHTAVYRMPCVYEWQGKNRLMDDTLKELLAEEFPLSFSKKNRQDVIKRKRKQDCG